MSDRTRRRAPAPDLDERIVDTAIALAEERSWANVRLHDVATRLDIGLDVIGSRFRDLDAVANAWFGRARHALLRTPTDLLTDRAPPERLHVAMMSWFDALAPHRAVAGEMLRAKLHPSHPHHWVPMIFDLSRLMHDFLDVARIASTGRQRALAEVGLTLIFLATLRDWLREAGRTPELLLGRLRRADRWLGRLTP
jgi:AcrR family transcriptional regulator